MASKSVNKVILIGNLTRDPELKYTPSGTAVCTFGVATNRTWTTNEGETKEDVQFHRIVAWQKLGELVAKLLTKGRKVYLEGRISYKEFVGKDGLKKNLTEIIMDDFVLFDDRRKDGAEESIGQATASAPTNAADKEPEIPVANVEEAPTQQKSENTDVITDDDIPF